MIIGDNRSAKKSLIDVYSTSDLVQECRISLNKKALHSKIAHHCVDALARICTNTDQFYEIILSACTHVSSYDCKVKTKEVSSSDICKLLFWHAFIMITVDDNMYPNIDMV